MDSNAQRVTPELSYRFDGTNPEAQAVAAKHGAKMVTRITKETEAGIRTIIETSIAQGIPPYDAARMIRSMVGMTAPQARAALSYREELINSGLSMARVERAVEFYVAKKIRQRAVMIARTEIMQALNAGQYHAWRQAQQNGFLPRGAKKEWIVTPDERLCPECEPLDGKTVGLHESFGPAFAPPLHPSCFPADALVLSVGGVAAASVRRFDGDILVLRTALGHKLACTPNHPILTSRGWIPARLLNVGGDVISGRLRQWERVARDVDDQNVPARIEEVADAARRSTKMFPGPMPVAAEDFHGDGGGSEVAVVWSDRYLRDSVNPAFLKQLRELDFDQRGSSALLVRFRASNEFGKPRTPPARGSMRTRDLSPTLCTRHLRPLQGLSLGLIADLNASLRESTPNDGPSEPVFFRDSILREADDVISNDMLDGDAQTSTAEHDAASSENPDDWGLTDAELAGDLIRGRAGLVTRDYVVGVDVQSFTGHVFNLETGSGALWADGILTHNCRCTTGIATE